MSEDVFRNTLVTLFTTIQKEFPDFDRQTKKCYLNFNKSDPREYIIFTKESFKPHLKSILKSDVTIFENSKIKFIRGLNFSDLWSSYPDKFMILWGHLQRLYISVYNYSKDKGIEITKEEEKYAERFIEIVKLDYAIKDELKSLEGNSDKSAQLKETMNKLKEIFEDKNSILTKTLKEVIGEIVPQNLSNPEEFIQSLVNGDKIAQITTKLTDAIKRKFESGELKEEDIKHDLERIKTIFESSTKNSSFVTNIMENMKKEK